MLNFSFEPWNDLVGSAIPMDGTSLLYRVTIPIFLNIFPRQKKYVPGWKQAGPVGARGQIHKLVPVSSLYLLTQNLIWQNLGLLLVRIYSFGIAHHCQKNPL